MVKNYYPVWFNQKDKLLFEEIKEKGLISEEFNSFIKRIFHNKIENLVKRRIKRK